MACLPESSPWHSDDARCILQDIANFIPLGCLISQGNGKHGHEDGAWTEIFYCPDDLSSRLRKQLGALIAAGWIRTFATSRGITILRLYLLAADVGHRSIDRSSRDARVHHAALREIVTALDTSPGLWNGNVAHDLGISKFEIWATADPGSLFWMFNNIPSPKPLAKHITHPYRREALMSLLESNEPSNGLKTKLYPYQRRAAGLMLQRESACRLLLDPRLERRTAPDGTTFYYSARDFLFFRQIRRYEAIKGGILAETMGLGKTIITLALVLSTRGCLPQTPVEYLEERRRDRVGSLMDMCVSSAHAHSIPWKQYFEDLERSGEAMTECVTRLRQSTESYSIPQIPPRFNRTTVVPPPKIKTMTPTTIIVVPRNLCSQWQSEIEKHVESQVLSVLVMDDLKRSLPPAGELRLYDVILFSRNRFEQESRDGSDRQGRRMSKTPLGCNCPYIGATRTRDCTCLRSEDLYESPLKELHFLRIVIDEGHSFSSHTSAAAHVAEKLVTADHRWVVSGTPAKDLLGVEMDLYTSDQSTMSLNDEAARAAILAQRKDFDPQEDVHGAVKGLGALMTHFLQVKPWSNGPGEPFAAWDEYIYRHEDAHRKTYAAFSGALRQSLESLVIKTRPEDVEQDIELPPLTHEIVKLEPSYYDKITSNLFTFVLTANAVTSERTDRDYLFHKESTKARYQLINNLRQSAFFWTGFSRADIDNTVANCERYLQKEDKSCAGEDVWALRNCIQMASRVISCAGWNELSATHELGVFLEDWPRESAEHWTLDHDFAVLTGVTQLADAQRYIHSQLMQNRPDLDLSGEGIRSLVRARARGREETKAVVSPSKNPLVSVPNSGVAGEPSKKRHSPYKRGFVDEGSKDDDLSTTVKPWKRRKKKDSRHRADTDQSADVSDASFIPPKLPGSSGLAGTRLIGTVSAKASYLISRILALHSTEKILIFYTGDNSAYYIAQLLEILHIPHLIYARSLPAATKSQYVVDFNEQYKYRVMLMDVGQAAYGLNLCSASRVFFINPVCRPQLEAQAIKRAHRIGQTKEVKVETLILKGTIEEGMWERARRMSRAEHMRAKVLEDDDGVKDVIQGAQLMELDGQGSGMAALDVAQVVFGREGWWEEPWINDRRGKPLKRDATASDVRYESRKDGAASKANESKRKRVAFSSVRTEGSEFAGAASSTVTPAVST